MSDSTGSCCPTTATAVKSDYKSVGETVRIDDFDMYTVGDGKEAIVLIYDIVCFFL
jgi:hypothetical protein